MWLGKLGLVIFVISYLFYWYVCVREGFIDEVLFESDEIFRIIFSMFESSIGYVFVSRDKFDIFFFVENDFFDGV